ncbi:methionine/alanine import family NSS transporter small subunit [Metabacillus fastidiosus]|nr:methionine/alanine import family NSS transporter small subunit [Metabacillus fastidiosus]
MSAGAITMMVVGIVIIWGGLAASIANAVVKAKRNKNTSNV